MLIQSEIRHFHLFCGLGAGARGFNKAQARVGNLQGAFRCLGGIDVDPVAIENFGRLTGTPGTVLDLFDPEDPDEALAFGLAGDSDQTDREQIGNAVPCESAASIGSEMGRTLLLARSGETFQLSCAPVWVRPVAAAINLAQGVT